MGTSSRIRHIRAERHISNRELVLELDSPAYFRRSLIVLDGSDAALIHERLFESLETGAYEVRVVLQRLSQEPLRGRVIFDVVGATPAGS